MSVLTLIALAAVLGLVLGHTPAIAQDVAVAVIRYDPFAEPDLTQPPQTRQGASARNQAWSPVLRATLVAGRGSMELRRAKHAGGLPHPRYQFPPRAQLCH